MEKEILQTTQSPITSEELLEHWQGHRRLSRRVIDAFPEDKLFSLSIGGMRTFAELAQEMIEMAAPGIHGMVTGEWIQFNEMKQFTNREKPKTKPEIFAIWDEVTELINNEWPKITPERFREIDNAYGQYKGTIISFLFYFIDNEIHHRGQGYVYLRSLGIAPPFFWERD
jgi:uncharacterized damage-inducible protein DinB